MQLDLDRTDGNFIHSFERGRLRINNRLMTEPVIVTATEIFAGWSPPDIPELDITSFAIALQQEPDVILFGTGMRQRFPSPQVMTGIMKQGIGFEVMDTAAACRTFNVLSAEQRRVVAALLLR